MSVFTVRVSTSGGLISSFVFQDTKELADWKLNKLPKLEAKYGKLVLSESALPGLKIGDRCTVVGEGSEVFTIMNLKKYSDHRYGFCLDSGCCEEVSKCYEV